MMMTNDYYFASRAQLNSVHYQSLFMMAKSSCGLAGGHCEYYEYLSADVELNVKLNKTKQ
jgi:hypothetical protein